MVISTLKVSQFLGFALWKKGRAEREWRWSVPSSRRKERKRRAYPPLGRNLHNIWSVKIFLFRTPAMMMKNWRLVCDFAAHRSPPLSYTRAIDFERNFVSLPIYADAHARIFHLAPAAAESGHISISPDFPRGNQRRREFVRIMPDNAGCVLC